MRRSVLAVVAGLVAWLAVVVVASVAIRALWPEYVSVAASMAFTLPMKLARLAISAVGSIAGGWVAAAVSRGRRLPTALPGVLLLAAFIPQHIQLWDKFPLWYHLTFLLTLVPLSVIGGRLYRDRAAAGS